MKMQHTWTYMKIGTKMANEGLRKIRTYIASQQINRLVVDGQIGNKKIERQKDRKKEKDGIMQMERK